MIIPLSSMPWIWLGLTVLLLIIEGLTSGLTTIWFAIGSFLTIFLAAFKCPIWIQVCVFVFLSLLLLIFTRPILKRRLAIKKTAMNSDAIIGKKATVTQEISELKKGAIKINGLEWTAAPENNQTFKAGETCVVSKIQGATAFVSPIPANEENN